MVIRNSTYREISMVLSKFYFHFSKSFKLNFRLHEKSTLAVPLYHHHCTARVKAVVNPVENNNKNKPVR